MSDKEIRRGSTSLALKAGFWYVFSTFVTKGLAFVTTPIFARLMTTADYGEFTNFASWQGMLIIIVGAELYNTLSRAYYDYENDYDQFASSVMTGSCVLTIAFYILFIVCGKWIFRIVNIPPQFVHLMFFTMLFQNCKQIYLTRERTLYRYKSVAILTVLSLGVPTILSIIIVACVPEAGRLAARMYGFYVPYALVGVYCAGDLMRRGRTFRWDHFRYAMTLTLPLLANALTAYLLTSTNTIITKSVLGAEPAAMVSVVGSIMNILIVLFQSVTGAVTTWLMDNMEQGKYREVKLCSVLLAGVAGLIAIGIILLGPEIIWIFGGSKYKEAIVLLPGMSFAIFLQIVTTLFTIILTYEKSVFKTAVITSVAGVLAVVAKVVMLAGHGYEILPLINVIAFACVFVANYLLVVSIGDARVVDIKGILAVAAIVFALMMASGILYEHILIRYGITLAVGLVTLYMLYRTRDKWIPVIKKTRKA